MLREFLYRLLLYQARGRRGLAGVEPLPVAAAFPVPSYGCINWDPLEDIL